MCLRGASAIEKLLEQHPSERVQVFVVWEPILAIDWGSPGRLVRSRIKDPRVIQFWDKNHLVAQELSRQLHAGLEPRCCRQGGILWDVAALYSEDAPWRSATPELVDGPVVDAAEEIEKWLAQRRSQPKAEQDSTDAREVECDVSVGAGYLLPGGFGAAWRPKL